MRENFFEELLNISRRMMEFQDLDSLLDYTLSVIVHLVKAQRGYVILINAETNDLEFKVAHDTLEGSQEISESILRKALEDRQPLRLNDALTNPDFQDAESVRAYQLRSVMVVPLITQDHLLGAIYVENRHKANLFQQDDLEILNIFATQTAATLHSALLTKGLRESRERIVMAREEERRRLHRDLHDGLGPSLAAMALHIDTIRNYLSSNPARADELLLGLQEQVTTSLGDIRRIVYELRPPALDELGLLSALREHITTYYNTHHLKIALYFPPVLPPLSAAAEVAIYRIVQEALTNIITHAQAHHVWVSLHITDTQIEIDIADDGVGMSPNDTHGVGLMSMKERASEMGGVCKALNRPEGGFVVRVWLPHDVEEGSEA